MSMHLKRGAPPLGPTLMALVMVACLLGLGTWQVRRLAWKTALLHDLAQAYDSDPALTLTDFTNAERNHPLFLHGHVTGRLIHQDTMLVGLRTHEGSAGYHVLTPLRLDGGGTVLVNRGWIPLDKAKLPFLLNSPDRDVRITGLVRQADRPNPFTPANRPAANAWYIINTVQMAKHTSLALPSYVLYAERINGVPVSFPLTFDQKWSLPNNHLQYAVFWFTMAGFLCAMFVLRFFIVHDDQR